MSSVKNLKKDINYTLGDIFDICDLANDLSPNTDNVKSEAIKDEIIVTFDELLSKVNAKNVENKKAHFKSISAELETKAKALIGKINDL